MILPAIRKQFRLNWWGHHGVRHWARVRRNGRIIAQYGQAGKLSGGDTTHESILAGSSSIGEAIAADLIDTRMREIKQAQARAAMDRMTGALIDMPA